MSVTATRRKRVAAALVLGATFTVALTTGTFAGPRHHKARHHAAQHGQDANASAPYQPRLFAPEDPTLYAIRHHIPVPDHTVPGIYPTSPAK